MTRQYRFVLALVATGWLLPGAPQAQSASADYTFHQILWSGASFDPFGFDAPVLNLSGAAAFNATRINGRSGLFRSSGGSLTTIALQDGFSRFGSPSINAAGHVGFEASFSNISGEGIFRGNGGPTTTIAGTRAAGDFDFVNARPSINASRQVAFIGERIVGGDFIDGVYVGNGGPVTAIYDATGPFADFTGNPSLNDSGAAAFLATLDTGVGGLFLGNGGEITTVADENGPFTSVFGFSDPSLNERGEVAFRAGTNVEDPDDNSGSTGEGIFLFSEGMLATIVQGSFSDFAALGNPSLNNRSEVAFLVEPDFGQQILVIGPDLVDDRVISVGDVLLGRTVSALLFSREGLNDVGQLAFTAFFEDGTAGVYVATPRISQQPDLHIANQGENNFIGNNIYNRTGFKQTRVQTVPAGVAATYIIRLQNDGSEPAEFKVNGTAGNELFSVRYFNLAQGNEITFQVTGAKGWRPGPIAPGDTRRLRLVVTPTRRAESGAQLEVLVRARSISASPRKDVVKAVTTTR